MSIKTTDPTVSQIAALLGSRGGKTKTAKKSKASSLNLAKARAVRMKRLSR
jgi:hypothetical protein